MLAVKNKKALAANENETPGVAEGSRRERAKDERRARIIQATHELMREVGMDDLSVKMIADRAEVSPATVYNLFRTKGAVMERVYELDLRDFEALVVKAKSADALDRIFDAVAISADLHRADPGFYRSMMLLRDASDQQTAARLRRSRVAFWSRMLRAAAEEGHLQAEAASEPMAVALTQISNGVVWDWVSNLISVDQMEREVNFALANLLASSANAAAQERLQTRLAKLGRPSARKRRK